MNVGSSVRVQSMKIALDCGSMQCKAKGFCGVVSGFEERIMPRPGISKSVTFRINGGGSGQLAKRNPGHQAGALSIKKGEGLFLWFGLYKAIVFKLWNVVKENIKILTKY